MTTGVRVTKKKILAQLGLVLDPEMNISIVDLGLVYDVKVNKDATINIVMTLTTMGCPLFGVIEADIYQQLSALGIEQKQVKIDLTFDPPWDIERLTARGKAMLGI